MLLGKAEMKPLLFIAVIFLAVIAYKMPTAEQIGDEVALAPGRLATRASAAAYEREKKEDAEVAQRQQKEASEAAERKQIAEQERAQAEFDALPKWSLIGFPMNRVPPPGLRPTVNIPPAPPRPASSKTEPTAEEIQRKYGSK